LHWHLQRGQYWWWVGIGGCISVGTIGADGIGGCGGSIGSIIDDDANGGAVGIGLICHGVPAVSLDGLPSMDAMFLYFSLAHGLQSDFSELQ